MLAALLRSVRTINLENYPLRALKANEILVKVECCGVCGTDHHIYDGKAHSSIPVILGHEFSGVVADANGSDFKTGDKVVIDPNIYCGYCNYCRRGRIQFCENLKALGVDINGGFAEYSIVPVSQAYKLPADFDLSVAAFTEPVSCCLRGMKHASIGHGDSVIIVGGGTIGLIMIQLARIAGAARIILVEPVKSKQQLGLQLGADSVIGPDDENLTHIVSRNSGGPPDVIIECAGRKQSVELSVKLSGKGTKIVIFGLAPSDHNVQLNLQFLFRNEIRIFNSLLNPYTFKPALELLVNKRIEVRNLISNRVSLDHIGDVFTLNNDSRFIKQQII